MIIIIDCNKFQSRSNPGIQGLFEAGECACNPGPGCMFSLETQAQKLEGWLS